MTPATMSFDSLGDLHSTPKEAITYSHFFNSKGEMAMRAFPEARAFFQQAKLVADLGCGTASSTIFAHGLSPNAEIITVDNQHKPYSEVVELLQGKHQAHHLETIQRFLSNTDQTFDVVYIVKASHAVKEGDVEKLAKHTNANGFILQIDGDVELPPNMSNYYDPVWFDKYEYQGGEAMIVNALWRRK